MKSFISTIAFGRHYTAASLFYLGMTFLLLCAALDIVTYARAGEEEEPTCTHTVTRVIEGKTVTETEAGCDEGYTCCESTGECVEIE